MVLASASFWSTLSLRGKRSSRLWGLSRAHRHVSLRQLSEEFPFLGFLLALFALGNVMHCFLMASYLAVPCPVFGRCLWSTENWILWGAMLGSTADTCSASIHFAFGRFAHIFD